MHYIMLELGRGNSSSELGGAHSEPLCLACREAVAPTAHDLHSLVGW